MSSKDEVDSPNSYQIEPVDLNTFFEDDGKIYGYNGLKVDFYRSLICYVFAVHVFWSPLVKVVSF